MKTDLCKLPIFDAFGFRRSYEIEHAAEITAADTPEKQAGLQTEFETASKIDEKRSNSERKRIGAENAEIFLANPQIVINQLDEERGRSLDLGTMLQSYGIAQVTLKRRGKGTLRHKGTIAEGTVSNFIATVRIGERIKEIEIGSYNDSWSKAGSASYAANSFALEIARENS